MGYGRSSGDAACGVSLPDPSRTHPVGSRVYMRSNNSHPTHRDRHMDNVNGPPPSDREVARLRYVQLLYCMCACLSRLDSRRLKD